MAEFRIYITGSRGIMGGHVMRHLKQLAPQAELIENTADLRDIATLRSDIETAGPIDLVLHLAAIVAVESVQQDPAKAYAVNVGGTLNLLDAVTSHKPRFVYCSSAHVYASSEAPLRETDRIEPVSLYGRTKWLGEVVATDIAKACGFPLAIGRVFSIHDAAQTGSYLRPRIEARIAAEDLSQPFELWGADSLRDFLPAEEAARLLVCLALSDATGPVNIGSGKATSVRDFAQSFAPVPLKIEPRGSSNNLVADISRLNTILNSSDD